MEYSSDTTICIYLFNFLISLIIQNKHKFSRYKIKLFISAKFYNH